MWNKTWSTSLGKKSGFPIMGTLWKPLKSWHQKFPRSFHFEETPMWFPLGFHTWKQSTRGFHLDSLNWKLGGNLTSGFPEFPHLETVNPRIPPRFLVFETLQVVYTSFHTWKQSTRWFNLVSSHCKFCFSQFSTHVKILWNLRIRTSLLIFHRLAQSFQNINFIIIIA